METTFKILVSAASIAVIGFGGFYFWNRHEQKVQYEMAQRVAYCHLLDDQLNGRKPRKEYFTNKEVLIVTFCKVDGIIN